MFGEYRARLIRKFLVDQQATPVYRSCPYVPRSNDVIICGYFRTGVSWLQQILHQIRCGGGDESYDDIDQVVWYIPPYMERLDFHLNASQPPGELLRDSRLFRCNDCFEDAPAPLDSREEISVKYVIIVRDPMDVAWSEARSRYRNLGVDKDYDYYSVAELNPSTPSRQSEKHQFARPVYYPTYWEHFLSWWPHKDRNNVLWLHYEDLEKDLRLCIGELARFIGVELTDKQAERIYDYCTYHYMRENIDKFAGDFLTQLRSNMLAVEPWRPLVGRLTRHDGAQSGQGSLNLSEKIRAKIRWNWRHSIEKLTGYKSYSQLYAANSLVSRLRAKAISETVDIKLTLIKDTNTLQLL